ncbi:hypothetical protein ACIB24_09680 [Spongisporangium articulatum]|uniref:Uncharacterized protein n=1 Tax=Spongisporangium articulatum TaxID=3362603 RepID=A0ABW8ALT7_9ACTN
MTDATRLLQSWIEEHELGLAVQGVEAGVGAEGPAETTSRTAYLDTGERAVVAQAWGSGELCLDYVDTASDDYRTADLQVNDGLELAAALSAGVRFVLGGPAEEIAGFHRFGMHHADR